MSDPKKPADEGVEVRFYDAADRAEGSGTTKGRYVKDTVNLCMNGRKDISLSLFFLLLSIVLFLLIVVEFCFAYLPYRRLEEAEAALEQEQDDYYLLWDSMSDYEEVREDYLKYNYENFDRTIVGREDVFTMLEETVFPCGKIESLSVSGNLVSLVVTDVPDDALGAMQTKIREHRSVERVSVYGTTIEDSRASVQMTIFVKNAEED